MKILVTGGAGFVGSHLAERCAKAGHEVLMIDDFDDYYSREIKERNLRIALQAGNSRFVEGDVADIAFLRTVMKDGIDVVFHEAARPGVRSSICNPFKPNHVNVVGTLNVLQASLECGVRRVVNASSSSIYGQAQRLPLNESHTTNPLSPYGVSKLAAEHYCRVYWETYGLTVVSLRYFTVYGSRMRPDLAIYRFTQEILGKGLITVYGDGEQTRDFTNVEDVIDANLKLLTTDKADGRVINIGSGERTTVNGLIKNLSDLIGIEANVEFTDAPKGEPRDTLADVSLAERLIGYKPRVRLPTGLEKFVEWYRENCEDNKDLA